MSKIKLRKKSFQWHLWLAWIAAFALCAFIVSGLTHPLLAWTGPQSKAFMPPKAVMQADQVNAIKDILQQHQIDQAIMVKLVPSEQGVVLQVTEHNDQPRRYFALDTNAELLDFDRQQAQWLARYYALGGGADVAVKDIQFQTEFDSAYPWVNRLLPVYKVTFDHDDGLSTYVYTEINALAGLSNHYKTRVQSVFRALHTWAWLDRFDNVRIIILACLLISIIAMTLTGFALVLLLKKRPVMTRKARLHRYLAYGLWLPLLFFSVSGFWHLLHAAYSDVQRGLKLGEPMSLSALSKAPPVADLPTMPLNQISLVQHDETLLYRLSVAPKRQQKKSPASSGEHAHHDMSATEQRQARFDGQPTEQGSYYYAASSGQAISLTDKELATAIAAKQLDLQAEQVLDTQLVKRFGPHYDFRNKRLPVWQITFDSELGDRAFIDPATGMLVDRLVDLDRYEAYSFSFLHKWNFLTPFMGRQWRDVVVVIVLLLTLLLTGLGFAMRLRHR